MFNDNPQHFYLTLAYSYSVLRGFKNLVMASRIQIGKVVTVKGRRYKIGRGTAKGKKYKATPLSGKGVIQFGAKGYNAKPNTPKGDNYCARSSGIKSSKKGATANTFSRMLWNCNGKKSMKR
jgi:hypothetical protein